MTKHYDVIIAKVADCIKKIENLNFEELLTLSKKNKEAIPDENLLCSNTESIEVGISGYLLFLLEFYKFRKDSSLLSKIEEITQELICYCRTNNTLNYSLYTGRGGVVYFLLQLYDVTKNENLLVESVDLIKTSGEDYLESTYTSDYLYDGRSGTLLVLIELYSLIKSNDEIFSLIDKFSHKIVKNALLSEQGVSWKANEEINLKNSCGFASGNSGIVYVLRKLNSIFPNVGVEYIISNAQKYIQYSWDTNSGSWLNYQSDINNSTILETFKKQYCEKDELLFMPSSNLSWSSGKNGIQLSLDSSNIHLNIFDLDFSGYTKNIYNGVSGIGLSLLINAEINSAILLQITNYLLEQIEFKNIDNGLMYGDLGGCYFLLKSVSNEKESSIINPMTTVLEKSDCKLSLEVIEIKKILLKRYYGRTLVFLENIAPKILNGFILNLKNTDGNLIEYFENFVINQLESKKNTLAYSVLEDVYSLENEIKKIFEAEKRTNLEIYLDTIFYNEKIIGLLNKSDAWLYEQKICISDKIQIVKSKWDWVSRENFNFIENFYSLPYNYEYLLLSSYENHIKEYSLKIDGLVLHRFDHGNSINQALVEIRNFCETQPPQVIEEFTRNTGSTDVKDFIKRLDFLVSHKVKQLLYDGVLQIVN